MQNLRKYGNEPYNVILVHGGPGTPGEMAPVAKEIAKSYGVLEPFQSVKSIAKQVDELKGIFQVHGQIPITLIGHSWGAWLSFIFTARYPELVNKLVLIASGPFEDKYVEEMMETRLSRLNEEDRLGLNRLMDILYSPAVDDQNKDFEKLGKLISKTDSFEPLQEESEIIEYQYNIYQSIWPEAEELRRSGRLLEYGKQIRCPVVAIHGDHDPHPYEGVEDPLSIVLKDFRFVLLENCGHTPWLERDAKERFFKILKNELLG